MTGMAAITMKQPGPAFVIAGTKTIETRPRPTKHRGPVIIHAAKDMRLFWQVWERGHRYAYHTETAIVGALTPFELDPMLGDDILPHGAVVGSAVLVDCVPIIDETDPVPDGPFVYADLGNFVQVHDGPDDSAPAYSEEEIHLGDFTPGRWALLLDDAKPTTDRCPWCWGRGWVDNRAIDPLGVGVFCPVCNEEGHCDPIPARGQQAVPWKWDPS